jgi:SAM-dependent methyltransferase
VAPTDGRPDDARTAGSRDSWASGAAYEPYVGRWSRLVARDFLVWLSIPAGADWLDVGCGTGALSESIVDHAAPGTIVGIDASPEYVVFARKQVRDARVRFEVADAQELPFEPGSFDAVVSGLVLNFVLNPQQALKEMTRVARPGGTVAVYVWDYAGRMELMRHFWDAAVALDPDAAELDEGRRFPLCRPEPLEELFRRAGLSAVEIRAIDVPTVFRDFDDYWSPFLGGQGPAPGYALSLDKERRARLCERIRAGLERQADGSIHLIARAWAARGTR